MEDIVKKQLGLGRSSMRNAKWADPTKPRCLVTGHKGYIGGHLYQYLKTNGYDTIGIDIKDGHDINVDLNGGVTGDAFHPLYFNFKPEIIFHLACRPRVGYSVKHPVETTENNILATTNVLNFANKVGAKRVIFSSSSSVVGEGSGPISPYALQKLYSEMECKLYTQLYGVDTVSLRYFNVYSEDQPHDGAYTTFVANWMHHIRSNQTPFLNGDGSIRRDMVHVNDVISANLFFANYDKPLKGEQYDIGTGCNISMKETIELVKTHFPELEYETRPPRGGDVSSTKANPSRAKKLGWQPSVSIEEGLAKCFQKLQIQMEKK